MTVTPRPPWTAVPYEIYTDPAIYAREQERIFGGRSWNYVGLEAEIPRRGDYKTTAVGDRPVIVARGDDGAIGVFENRCAHRGVALCSAGHGNAKTLQCPYHQWTYDLSGKLIGIPFRNGIGGRGGMPAAFEPREHGLTPLRVTTRNGVIFASYSGDVEPIEDYLGEKILPYFDRMFDGRELRVLGYWRQRIDCNWKLIVENIRDPYHATLLHVFLVTFGLNRADQPGKAILDAHGRHGAMMNERVEGREVSAEAKREMKSLLTDLKLEGPRLLDVVREFPGPATVVMQTIWPNIILQQQSNAVAIRQIVTTGSPDAFEFHWTVFGYAADDEEMTRRRVRLANLMGPSGLVSIDDTEVIELTQRGAAHFREAAGVIEMGGDGTGDVDYTVTEAPLRAFHKYYREVMGL
jgi:salicylate 5-hydroxylase large subunit